MENFLKEDYATIKLYLQDTILTSNLGVEEMNIFIKIIKYINQEMLIKILKELKEEESERI